MHRRNIEEPAISRATRTFRFGLKFVANTAFIELHIKFEDVG